MSKQNTVSALKRGIAVLQCFGNGARSLSNGELSQLTKVPKPTVTRLAATLVALGLLRQDPDSEKYSLGAGVLSLSQAFLAGLDVRAHARPHMMKLAEAFGGSVLLAVREGLEMVVIEACRARAPVLTVRLDVGARLPLASSALGRAYLAALEPPERSRLLEQLKPAGIEGALRDASAHGYSASLGEFYSEINSIAAAIVLPGGERVALNCGGPAFSFPERRLRDEVAPRLLAAARAIAAETGGDSAGLKAA
jgi:DNA-binding IclR family transcriptional regulator